MASPSASSGQFASEAARDYSALVSSSSPSSHSLYSDDGQREDNQNGQAPDRYRPQDNEQDPICPWRNRRFHQQECSRYFDCPSHTIERSLSEHGSEDEESIHSSSLPHANDDRSQFETQTVRFLNQELAQVGITRNEALPTAFDVTDDDRNAASATYDDPISNQYRSGPAVAQESGQPSSDTPQTSQSTYTGGSSHNMQFRQRDSQTAGSSHPDHRIRTSQETNAPNSQGPQRMYTTPSRERMDAPLPSLRSLEEALPPLPRSARQSISSDPQRPRWQPDNEVTYCPICHTQFSFFIRKHHCRKCGRVVCNACSPHRIIIPHQYIVRQPGSDAAIHQSLLVDGLGAGYFDVNDISGGERVRLCNPCVPDPNTAPPQSPSPQATLSPRASHQRSRSSIGDAYGTLQPSHRHGAVFAPGTSGDPYRYLSLRTRSVTMGSASSGSSPGPSYRRRSGAHQSRFERLQASSQAASPSSYPERYSSLGESSSRQRALPPTPQIAEEDECPVCHRELPSQSLPNAEELRQSHITNCIQTHSAYGTLGGGEGGAPSIPRLTGMYCYSATEKDCIDDAECTICLEEFTVGDQMARLECLCRFHKHCISSWFRKHPGRCPVHQHGLGY
ncbi:PIB1-phosphatidylinositol(3)-phosphate binding [Fusarium beomiforme]|uniref:RING-type E3 ubiquitin transferase n=1 Tax=Fusarium beomiforme TaxID=44412 RepID=A0A9P5AG29_9HYPO|nr:PIB1-phosphatidylinositol(3)-phosphate binding [Fusarium beomiforme]